MAQIILSPERPTWANYLSGLWSISELQLRIEHNIANRAAWGILKDQSEDILDIVLSTLHGYAITWTPEDNLSTEMAEASDFEGDDEEFGNMPLDANRIVELYVSTEANFKKA
jgi:hypothetical protein